MFAGIWHDVSLDTVTFRVSVERDWLPSKHLEPSTLAGYRSYLDRHFFPFFGERQMGKIRPSIVQDRVSTATVDGLSPRSVRKYHTMLNSLFTRAMHDRAIVTNPCEHTELRKSSRNAPER